MKNKKDMSKRLQNAGLQPADMRNNRAEYDAFCKAAKEGRADDIVKMLDKHPEGLKYFDEICSLALLGAAAQGHKKVISLLIKKKINLTRVVINLAGGVTALHAAAQGGHEEVVELLLNANKELLNMHSFVRGVTPLRFLVESDFEHDKKHSKNENRYKIMQRLIEAKADLETRCKDGLTSLFVACNKRDTAAATLLLKAKANVNAPCLGITPLANIAIKGDQSMVETLVNTCRAADYTGEPLNLDARCEAFEGSTALMVASAKGKPETVKFLIESKASIEIENTRNHRALIMAITDSNFDTMRMLLSMGASATRRLGNDIGLSPLMYACWLGTLESVKILIDHQAQVNETNQSGGFSPLMLAVSRNWYIRDKIATTAPEAGKPAPEIIDFLISCGASIYERATKAPHYSILQGAVCAGCVVSVKHVLQIIQKDLKQKNDDQEIHPKMKESVLEAMKVILRDSLENAVELLNIFLSNALYSKIVRANVDALYCKALNDCNSKGIKLLLDSKLVSENTCPNLSAKQMTTSNEVICFDGLTPLMFAAHKGDYNTVVLLIKEKAKLHTSCKGRYESTGKEIEEYTALMFAFIQGNEKVIQYLLGCHLTSQRQLAPKLKQYIETKSDAAKAFQIFAGKLSKALIDIGVRFLDGQRMLLPVNNLSEYHRLPASLKDRQMMIVLEPLAQARMLETLFFRQIQKEFSNFQRQLEKILWRMCEEPLRTLGMEESEVQSFLVEDSAEENKELIDLYSQFPLLQSKTASIVDYIRETERMYNECCEVICKRKQFLENDDYTRVMAPTKLASYKRSLGALEVEVTELWRILQRAILPSQEESDLYFIKNGKPKDFPWTMVINGWKRLTEIKSIVEERGKKELKIIEAAEKLKKKEEAQQKAEANKEREQVKLNKQAQHDTKVNEEKLAFEKTEQQAKKERFLAEKKRLAEEWRKRAEAEKLARKGKDHSVQFLEESEEGAAFDGESNIVSVYDTEEQKCEKEEKYFLEKQLEKTMALLERKLKEYKDARENAYSGRNQPIEQTLGNLLAKRNALLGILFLALECAKKLPDKCCPIDDAMLARHFRNVFSHADTLYPKLELAPDGKISTKTELKEHEKFYSDVSDMVFSIVQYSKLRQYDGTDKKVILEKAERHRAMISSSLFLKLQSYNINDNPSLECCRERINSHSSELALYYPNLDQETLIFANRFTQGCVGSFASYICQLYYYEEFVNHPREYGKAIRQGISCRHIPADFKKVDTLLPMLQQSQVAQLADDKMNVTAMQTQPQVVQENKRNKANNRSN